jgi:hypothetical protein
MGWPGPDGDLGLFLTNDSGFKAPNSDSIWLKLSFEGQAHSFALLRDDHLVHDALIWNGTKETVA